MGKEIDPVPASLFFVVSRNSTLQIVFAQSRIAVRLKFLRIESGDSNAFQRFEQYPPPIFPDSKVYRLLVGGRLVLGLIERVE